MLEIQILENHLSSILHTFNMGKIQYVVCLNFSI